MLWIALAGAPGAGKSALAAELARRLGCPVLDKDRVRAALFGAHTDHSRGQDDVVVAALYAAAAELGRDAARAPRAVVLDGRTYLKPGQLDALCAAAAAAGAELALVHCVADPEVLRARLAADAAAGAHPARDRGPELLARVLADAVPVPEPTLVLDTGRATPAELAERALAALGLGA